MAKYQTLEVGKHTLKKFAETGGIANANKPIILNAQGQLDPTMMPEGIGSDTRVLPASEALTAGDFVNVWNDAGTLKVRKADANSDAKKADGFVKASFASAANATVYLEGQNDQLSGLTLGADYYLSATVAGAATDAPLNETLITNDGKISQYLGVAVSATTISTEIDKPVVL